MRPLLSVENLTVEYAIGGKSLFAVSDVSLHVDRGETLGLVGESGCGKSTLGRAVLQLRRPTSGKVVFDGTDLTGLEGEAMRLMRRRLQLIFQDPIASLNPRRSVGDIVAEPLIIIGVSDRIAVMYLGRLCEVGPTEQLFARPAHPYTALLLEAIPVPDPTVKPAANVAVGEPPSPLAPPSGCRFRTRCPRADAVCANVVPQLREVARGQFAACHHPLVGS